MVAASDHRIDSLCDHANGGGGLRSATGRGQAREEQRRKASIAREREGHAGRARGAIAHRGAQGWGAEAAVKEPHQPRRITVRSVIYEPMQTI